MQDALVHQQSGQVQISNMVKMQINTFLALLNETDCPTKIKEIIPGDPFHEGAVDATKVGMGGVWFIEQG